MIAPLAEPTPPTTIMARSRSSVLKSKIGQRDAAVEARVEAADEAEHGRGDDEDGEPRPDDVDAECPSPRPRSREPSAGAGRACRRRRACTRRGRRRSARGRRRSGCSARSRVETWLSLRNRVAAEETLAPARTPRCCFTIARSTSAMPIVKRAKYTPRRRIVGAAMSAPSRAPKPAAPSSIRTTLSDRAPAMSEPACEPPEMYAAK